MTNLISVNMIGLLILTDFVMKAVNTSLYSNNLDNMFVWKVISPSYSSNSGHGRAANSLLYLSADCNQPMKVQQVSWYIFLHAEIKLFFSLCKVTVDWLLMIVNRILTKSFTLWSKKKHRSRDNPNSNVDNNSFIDRKQCHRTTERWTFP